MLSIQKWKCSWFLAAAIASIVALVSVVHLFLSPMGPSFGFLRQFQNFCIPINGSFEDLQPAVDLDHRFPAGLHKEVIYCGAPWKAEIGRWLSGCDSITKEVSTVEIIRGSNCKNDCSGQDICNRELGQCRCFHGYSGIFVGEARWRDI